MSWRHYGVADFFGLLGMIAVGIVVGVVAGDRLGWTTLLLLGALLCLIRISWPLRHALWFRSTIAVFFAADVAALAFVDWSFTDNWNGHALVGGTLLDLYTMMAIIYGLYRLKYGSPVDPIEDDPDELPQYADRNLDL
jgi:hypothetical protein